MPFLADCLGSLAKQTFPEFETIVVDNGSTDGSDAFIRDNFGWTRLIRLEENKGFAAASNIGIREAKGQVLALLNNDAEVDSHWLSELVAALGSNSEIGFCASRILMWRQHHLVDACGDFFTVEGVAGKIGHRQRAEDYLEVRRVFGASAGAAAYRRIIFDSVGDFDEDFFMVHEDSDLSFRAQLMGYQCLYVPTAVAYHRVGSSIGETSDLAIHCARRNSEFVYIKNMPQELLVKYWPLHLLTVLLQGVAHLRRGSGSTYYRAKKDAWRMMPLMLEKRREIQRNRRASDEYINSILTRGWLKGKIRERLTSKLRRSDAHGGNRTR
jgi:GT2 family glycosyltransferase